LAEVVDKMVMEVHQHSHQFRLLVAEEEVVMVVILTQADLEVVDIMDKAVEVVEQEVKVTVVVPDMIHVVEVELSAQVEEAEQAVQAQMEDQIMEDLVAVDQQLL
jgi:hypothetical protein